MLTTADVQAHAADAELAAALAAGDDESAAARLSQLLTEVQPVRLSDLAAWAAANGLRARLQDASTTPAHPLRSIALAALDLLRGGFAQSFDTVQHAGLLDAMQAGSMLSQPERDALIALATVPRVITPNEVARAVRNDDGSSAL